MHLYLATELLMHLYNTHMTTSVTSHILTPLDHSYAKKTNLFTAPCPLASRMIFFYRKVFRDFEVGIKVLGLLDCKSIC